MQSYIEVARETALKHISATTEQIEKGMELHNRLFTCDLFGFLPGTLSRKAQGRLGAMAENGASTEELGLAGEWLRGNSHICDDECRAHFDSAIRATGLKATVLACGSEKNLHHSLNRIAYYIHAFDNLQGSIKKATQAAEAETGTCRDGQLAVFCSANCPPAHGGFVDGVEMLRWIDIYYRFGIRIMHLTYNRRNWLGDGCMEPADAGLSLHGREVVKHMNRIGMVVDTPHSGQQTTIDAANHSKAPIMATHTACQSIHPHPRGKNNDALKAIADTGGLVGICAIPYFLGERGTLKDLLNHIDYAVDLMGVDHVGIGTDTTYPMPHYTDVPSPWEKYPKVSPYNGDAWYGAWESVQHLHTTPDEEQQQSLAWTNWPCFTVGLVARGYSEGDIAKIIGGNFLRVLRAVEESAEGLI